jgi:hypothetical protein
MNARVAALTMPSGKTDHYEWDDARELAVRLRKRGPKSKLAMKWYKGGNVGGRWKPILIGDVRRIKAEAAYGVAQHISMGIDGMCDDNIEIGVWLPGRGSIATLERRSRLVVECPAQR